MAREIVNLIAEGYDYIETLTHIADDKALAKDINFYRVAELMPVLRLHKGATCSATSHLLDEKAA